MNYSIITPISNVNLNDFISFWSKQYHYPKHEEKYTGYIDKKQFESTDIITLYEWKNNTVLSGKKQKSVNNKIISKLTEINAFKKQANIDLEAFKIEFKELTAVWKIFLLHIIKPKIYPIYDQHIHRAYLYVHDMEWKGLSNDTITDKKKEEFYFDTYLQFIENNKIEDLKKLDEAFFAFGQFLKTRKYSTLIA